MLSLKQVKIPLSFMTEDEEGSLRRFLSDVFSCREADIQEIRIEKKSVDARKKPDIYLIYSLGVRFSSEKRIEKLGKSPGRIRNIIVGAHSECFYEMPAHLSRDIAEEKRPLIIGDGPAGLFCAYILALSGLRPVILERGSRAEKRSEDVESFFMTNVLDPCSNVCFGEGGAGTFSDGKLNTLTKDRFGRQEFILKTFAKFGADSSIIYDAKPHIGTDRLRELLPNMRHAIEELGGDFFFDTTVKDIILEASSDGKRVFAGLVTEDGRVFASNTCVLACGHSARDTIRRLFSLGVAMKPKEYAMGFRIEHPQDWLDKAQYGLKSPVLPRADYKLSCRTKSGRGVWTFCMCPGGRVVNSSSSEGMLSVNGMSPFLRDGKNCNSAVICSVGFPDFSGSDALSAVAFQEDIERKAFALSNGKIPQQLFGDFTEKRDTSSFGAYDSDTGGLHAFGRLDKLFPTEITESLTEGIYAFGKRISGFDRPDSILSGVESRTSSPVRIERNDDFQSENVDGLYPCGEGAGYAGGIMSAAVDGMKVAERIAERALSEE